jgi:hypothetical protein
VAPFETVPIAYGYLVQRCILVTIDVKR